MDIVEKAGEWLPIDSAPHDGTHVLLFWPSWAYEIEEAGYRPDISIGWWTENPRLKVQDNWSEEQRQKFVDECARYNIDGPSYFTDQNEMDCMGQAQRHNWPTRWMPMPEFPDDFVKRDILSVG